MYCGVVRACGAERARFRADAAACFKPTCAAAGGARRRSPIWRGSRKPNGLSGAAAPSGTTELPTITVSAKPPPTSPKRNITPQPAATAPAPVPPPSPYQTGAPNVAGGTPVVPQMASQMVISGADLNSRPVGEPAEILEATPGLAVVQHSGGGKANQYYLRGYNLDHGTDMATFWDDVPINLPTNAHGQGYTDLNFLIPETISGLEVRKGPYWADVGDFDNAGALNISLRDSVDRNIQSVTAGSYGYTRLLNLGSVTVGGGTLLYAGEFNTENGPWVTAEDVRKFSGLARYTRVLRPTDFQLRRWPMQIAGTPAIRLRCAPSPPDRSVSSARSIPLMAATPSRFMLSTRFAHSDDNGMWKANAYVVKYTLNLFNNFTWFTTNPTLGDQFHQSDDRIYSGGAVSRTFNETLFNLPSQTVVGLQTRDDDINVGLTNTFRREFLSNTLSTMSTRATSASMLRIPTHWTDWWRTTVGLRGDYFAASVNSMLQPANSGNPNAAIAAQSSRACSVLSTRPSSFLAQVRAFTAMTPVRSRPPKCPATHRHRRPLHLFLCARWAPRSAPAPRSCRVSIARSACSICIRIRNCSLDGDTGTTVPGPPSVRTGIEITNNYQPVSWMRFDADLALTRARFVGFDTAQAQLFESLAGFPQAQIGNAPGNFIFEAPWMVASAGITLGEQTGWFSTLRWRYISSRPLTEDGVFQSPPVNTINGRVGYQFTNGWRIQLDALNLPEFVELQRQLRLRRVAALRRTVRQVLSCKRCPHGTGRGLPERLHGLFGPPAGPDGRAAHARRTDRRHQHSEDGSRIQTRVAHVPAAGAELRLDGILRRRLCRQQLAQEQEQCRQRRDGSGVSYRWGYHIAVGRWCSARLRLHAVVSSSSRRSRRYVIRRHQDSDGLGCFRHKRKPDNRLR